MSWSLNPVTFNTWLNWYTSQWDLFIESFTTLSEHPELNGKMYFKKADDNSYSLYRKVCQYTDLIAMDYCLQFEDKRLLIASIMFIVIFENCFNLNLKCFENEIKSYENNFSQIQINNSNDLELITENITKSKCEKTIRNNCQQDIFPSFFDVYKDFLVQSFNFRLQEILQTICLIIDLNDILNNYVTDIPLTVQMAAEDDSMINNVRIILN